MKKFLFWSFFGSFVFLIGWILWNANHGTLDAKVPWLVSIPYYDKMSHFLLVGGLALGFNLALQNRSYLLLNVPIFWGSSIVFVFMTLEEFSQKFNPNRSFDWMDLLSNYAGILFFGMMLHFLVRKRSSKLEIDLSQT